MRQRRLAIQEVNPLRPDVRWPVLLVEGILAVGIGIYTLLNEETALREIFLLIGLFLLVNGLVVAASEIMHRGRADPAAQFRLIRAGIGITTGLLLVVDRFVEFLGLNPSRVVAGLGLIGVGIVSLVGLLLTREEIGMRIGTIVGSMLLIVWGILLLYQAATDSSTTQLIGWTALVVGIGLIGLAIYRRQLSEAARQA